MKSSTRELQGGQIHETVSNFDFDRVDQLHRATIPEACPLMKKWQDESSEESQGKGISKTPLSDTPQSERKGEVKESSN